MELDITYKAYISLSPYIHGYMRNDKLKNNNRDMCVLTSVIPNRLISNIFTVANLFCINDVTKLDEEYKSMLHATLVVIRFTIMALTCLRARKDYEMSLVTRKPVFGVCDQARLKPTCSVTETSQSL